MMLEKVRVVTWKTSNKSFCKVTFYKMITKVFTEFRLIDKTQADDLTKREFYWVNTLRTLRPEDVNIDSDYK